MYEGSTLGPNKKGCYVKLWSSIVLISGQANILLSRYILNTE